MSTAPASIATFLTRDSSQPTRIKSDPGLIRLPIEKNPWSIGFVFSRCFIPSGPAPKPHRCPSKGIHRGRLIGRDFGFRSSLVSCPGESQH
ncbi:hypothetical protein PGT21_016483 [Puccinia graminis f. sp. tritici]|uniref:Uncharacterized protein n=1 Tax=Puccinia graminis f. sp. tritici TaxID=56615 RepID=A0A5B0QND0_PUCGR|nr:hypothetical protein PGT21_016483 [Puccinia graminis f. sp. tritici]